MGFEWIKTHHQALAPFNRFKEKPCVKATKLFANGKGALYIHIPFCVGKCKFCILHREYPSVPYEQFVSALVKEMREYSSFQAEIVYFGGGTPTLLPTAELGRILDFIENKGSIKEITVETTVSEFNEKKAEEMASLGINRISFGIQTFDNKKRKFLGRRSPGNEIVEKLKLAKKYFKVISIDLLYDLPYGNTLLEDVKKAVSLNVDGISIYPLVYNKMMSVYPHPSVEENERNFLEAYDYLSEHGYKHLSINHSSNGNDKFLYSEYFTHPEKPLIGMGPGAEGHAMNYETFHPPRVRRYMMEPYKVDVFSMPEDVFYGVRTIAGVLKGSTKISTEDFVTSLQIALDKGWIELKGKDITLLPRGLFWVNTLVYLMSFVFSTLTFYWLIKQELMRKGGCGY